MGTQNQGGRVLIYLGDAGTLGVLGDFDQIFGIDGNGILQTVKDGLDRLRAPVPVRLQFRGIEQKRIDLIPDLDHDDTGCGRGPNRDDVPRTVPAEYL